MFRKIAVLAGLCVLSFVSLSFAQLSDDPQRPDIVGWGGSNVSSTPLLGIDNDGDILPARNLANDVGESTRAFRVGYFGNLDVANGITNAKEYWNKLASGSLTGVSLPAARAFTASTGSLISGATFTYGLITQSSGAPRNVTIYVSSSIVSLRQGGAFSTTTLIGFANFYGVDGEGNFVQEIISFSTGNPSVGRSTDSGAGLCTTHDCNVNVGLGIGNVAFALISSFTVQVTSITQAYGLMTSSPVFVVGYGQKIGLANNIVSTASALGYNNFGDVYKITEMGGRDATDPVANSAIVVNPVYDTIIFQLLPNNLDDKSVWYRQRRTY